MALLPEVVGFDCGSDPWQLEVGKWLSAPVELGRDSAAWCCANDTSTWLYRLQETNELVGFGSLGQTVWRVDKDKHPVQILPNVALAKSFHGQPADADPVNRYSRAVLRDLLREAFERHRAGAPALFGLFVHPNNIAAIRLYQAFGLQLFPQPAKSGYRQMVRYLTTADGELNRLPEWSPPPC